MSRRKSELQRLYPSGVDADGRVRAMILALGGPADWDAVSRLWQAVQAELSLPAPAIAVSGIDAYQVWFALEEAVPLDEAEAFFQALRERYLGHIAPARLAWLPEEAWPGGEVRPGQWSAFVAPDLAPIFSDAPWLDIPPNAEGQAELLARMQHIRADAWRAALARLRPAVQAQPSTTAVSAKPGPPSLAPNADPRRFLLGVMNDEKMDLALRIEAAKALLHDPGKGA